MYILHPFMDVVLSEERQSKKWVGIFQLGIFWVGIFFWEFPRGSLMGANFPVGNFLGRIFLELKIKKHDQLYFGALVLLLRR